MKPIFFLLAFLLPAAFAGAQTTNFEKGTDYNDFIVAEQTKIAVSINEFMQVFNDSKDTTIIQDARKRIVIQANQGIAVLKKMPAFKGDTALRNSSMRLFGFYASVCSNEYAKMVRLIFSSAANQGEVRKEFGMVIADVTAREKIFDDDFKAAQQAFAKKNNFTLVANEEKKGQ